MKKILIFLICMTLGFNVSSYAASDAFRKALGDLRYDIIPRTDDARDMGSSTKQFKDGYFDGILYVDAISSEGSFTIPDEGWVGLATDKGRLVFNDETADDLNFLTSVVTIGDGTPGVATAVEELYVEGDIETDANIDGAGNCTITGSFIIGAADMSQTDLEKLDGITNGTAAAGKALVADTNIDIGTIRNLTATGTIQGEQLTSTDDATIADALTMGSDSLSAGAFTMKMGSYTSDPQFQISMSADANGDTTLAADTGDLIFTSTGGATTFNTGTVLVTSTTSTRPIFTLQNVNGDSNSAILDFDKVDTAATGDNTGLALCRAFGLDTGDNQLQYGEWKFVAEDVSNGDEASSYRIKIAVDDVLSEVLTLDGYDGSNVGQGDIILNAAQKDLDLTFYSSISTSAFVVDAVTEEVYGKTWNTQRSYQLAETMLTSMASPAIIYNINGTVADTASEVNLATGSATAGTYVNTEAGDKKVTPMGWYADIDGAAEYITTAATYQTSLDGSFTVSCWVKPDDGQPASEEYLFGHYEAGITDSIYASIRTDGALNLFYKSNGNGATYRTAASVLSDGVQGWMMITVVGDATTSGVGGIKIYKDGVVVADDTSNTGDTTAVVFGDYALNDNLYYGALNGNGTASGWFDGGISAFMLDESAYTAAKVWQQYVAQRAYYNK